MLQDIGQQFWELHKDSFGRAQRERKKRTVNIGGFDVLLVNNYDLNQVHGKRLHGGAFRDW